MKMKRVTFQPKKMMQRVKHLQLWSQILNGAWSICHEQNKDICSLPIIGKDTLDLFFSCFFFGKERIEEVRFICLPLSQLWSQILNGAWSICHEQNKDISSLPIIGKDTLDLFFSLLLFWVRKNWRSSIYMPSPLT